MSIEDLGNDIASQMYNAMIGDGGPAEPEISREEGVVYILKYINTMKADDKRDAAILIARSVGIERLSECVEGLILDLNSLDTKLILELHKLISTKISTIV